eukprot:6467101-Amphidinium_carterae.1
MTWQSKEDCEFEAEHLAGRGLLFLEGTGTVPPEPVQQLSKQSWRLSMGMQLMRHKRSLKNNCTRTSSLTTHQTCDSGTAFASTSFGVRSQHMKSVVVFFAKKLVLGDSHWLFGRVV